MAEYPTPSKLLVSLSWEFCKEQPLLVVSNMVLALVLAPLGDILLPHLYGKLVTAVEKTKKRELSWWPPPQVATPAIFVLLALATSQIGWLVKEGLDMHTAPLLENMVRIKLLKGLIEGLDGNLPGEAPTGHYIGQIARIPDIAAWWWRVLLDYAIPYGITLVWAILYYWYIDSGLMLCLGALIVAIVILILVSPSACRSAALQRDVSFNKIHDHADDMLNNLTAIYGGSTIEDELAAFKEHGLNYKKDHVSAVSCMMWYKSLGIPLLVVFVGLIIFRSCYLISAGKMTSGSFVSVFMITTALLGTLSWMLSMIREGTLDSGSLQSIHGDFFGYPALILPDPLRIPVSRDVPIEKGITMMNVTYGPLVDASLSFPAGKINLVNRPVGWGKSTMLRILAGLIVPTSGDVAIDGRFYSDIGLNEVRRTVAYMPQDSYLLNRTVYDNVVMGLSDVPSRQEVVQIAEEIGLWEVLSKNLSDGIETDVGKGGGKLSGGQKQLVWLLRIAIRVLHGGGGKVAAILLDEPTASLDASSRKATMRALSYIMHARPDVTIVLVDHKMIEP